MLIEQHLTTNGHVYRATSKIIGVRIGSCETGSGAVVLIDLADGKTMAIFDGIESEIGSHKAEAFVTWKNSRFEVMRHE